LKGTHLLNWKYVKTLLNEAFFDKLLEYNLKGSKGVKSNAYAYVNRISEKVAKYNQEEVDLYNITYGRMLKWLVFTSKLRKADIEIRRAKIAAKKKEREDKIEANEKMKEDKITARANKEAEIPEEERENAE